jgi:hypothetical protein
MIACNPHISYIPKNALCVPPWTTIYVAARANAIVREVRVASGRVVRGLAEEAARRGRAEAGGEAADTLTGLDTWEVEP